MSTVQLVVEDSSPCMHCNEDMAMGLMVCPSCNEEVEPRWNVTDFLVTFFDGLIVDGRAGGFVIGRHNKEDDIPMLIPVATGVFQITAMMQGGEFIISRDATEANFERIAEINAYKETEYIPIESIKITYKTRVINTNGLKGELMILIENGQAIINRAATRKYFSELDEINYSITQETQDNT